MSSNLHDHDLKKDGYYACDRREMTSFIPKDAKKILDVGCSEGRFGSLLKAELCAEVWGVEMCEKAAHSASSRLDKVIICNFENDEMNQLPENYFDCIVFNDVLEHFKNPWDVLRRISKHLTRHGVIVASIPNVRYFDNFKSFIINKEWNYQDEGVLDKTHLRFFTEKSMRDMFKVCGYKVEKVEGIYRIEFPWKFKLFNYILRNMFNDVRFKQFACVARKMINE